MEQMLIFLILLLSCFLFDFCDFFSKYLSSFIRIQLRTVPNGVLGKNLFF